MVGEITREPMVFEGVAVGEVRDGPNELGY